MRNHPVDRSCTSYNISIRNDYNIHKYDTVHLVTRLRGGCFIAGTTISMEGNKYANIEEIQINDMVMTFNMSYKRFEPKLVKNIIKKEVNELCIIKSEKGSKCN